MGSQHAIIRNQSYVHSLFLWKALSHGVSKHLLTSHRAAVDMERQACLCIQPSGAPAFI